MKIHLNSQDVGYRAASWISAVCTALIVMSLAAVPVVAQDPVDQITGIVTDEQGVRLSGIDVNAAAATPVFNENGDPYWPHVAWAQTDANGNFELAVPPGDYILEFSGSSNGVEFVRKWYEDTFSPDQATSVASHSTDPLTVVLSEGAHITGLVTDESTDPIEGIDVSAQLPDDNGGWRWIAGQRTGANGQYDLLVPPSTEYRIVFWDPHHRYVSEWYADACCPEQGQDVSAPGQADATLILAAHITGVVSDSSGISIPDIDVAAAIPATDDHGNPFWSHVAWARTDTDGFFDLALPPGGYRIEFWDSRSPAQYVGEWYHDVRTPDDAMPITAGTGDLLAVQLDEATFITGHVTDLADNDLFEIDVSAHKRVSDGNGGYQWQWYTGQWTDANGNYTLIVPEGDFWLSFGDPRQPAQYVGEWYDDVSEPSLGSSIRTVLGNPAIANASLAQAKHITGQVTDIGDHPIAGINVSAAVPDVDSNGNPYCRHVAWASTDSEGNYTLAVGTGVYFIEFFDSRIPVAYLSEWYDESQSCDTAVPVNPETNGPVNAQLSPASHIQGTIRSETGSVLAGIEISAHIYAPNPDGTDNWSWFAGQTSDSQGRYDLGLPAGDYWLFITDPNHPADYVSEWHPNAPDPSRGTMQSVSVGESIIVDVTLERAEHISGRVTDIRGDPLSEIQISVGQPFENPDENWDWPVNVPWAVSDDNGAFDLALPQGEYYLLFQDRRRPAHYVSEFFEDARVPSEAQLLSTNSGIPLDVVLEDAGHLYVRVSGPSAVSLEDMDVSASVPITNAGGEVEWKWFVGGYTEGNGLYDLILPSGTFWISARDPSPDPVYIGEWYEDAMGPRLGQGISVTAGSSTTITVELEIGRHITGVVTDDSGTPLPELEIAAADAAAVSDDAGNTYWPHVAWTQTDAGGAFDLFVAAGSYIIEAWGRSGSADYMREWYQDRRHPDQATPISTSAPSGITITLTAATHITGHVRDELGQPIEGVDVSAQIPDGNGGWEWINSVWTEADGAYDLLVPPGTYHIGFWDPQQRFLSEWHNNVCCPDRAESITAPATVDAVLTPAQHITGAVTDDANAPLADIEVAAAVLDTDENGNPYCRHVSWARTDASGHFDLLVADDSFYIEFWDGRQPREYLGEWYDDAPTCEQATSISSSAGTALVVELAATDRCDVRPTPAYMDLYGSAYLDGQPIPVGTKIEALNVQGDVVGCYIATQTGSYGYMRVYGADPTATPPIPGAEEGQAVSFRIAGQAAFASPPVNWSDGAEQEADLATTRTQSVTLDDQWNLVAFNVEPPDSAIATVLNSIDGIYDRIIGEFGIFSATIPEQYNTLHELYGGPSYYMRITDPPATVMVTGTPIAADTPIMLHPGWNWISYLPTVSLPITDALQSIDGFYQRVISLRGIYSRSQPNFNNLHTMTPGEGYLIYMDQAATLVYPTSGGAAAASPPAPLPACAGVTPTPYSTFVYGSVTMNGVPAAPGTLIEVVTRDGHVAGCAEVTTVGQYGFMHVYGADASTPLPGFAAGETLHFRVNGVLVRPAHNLTWQDDKTPHRIDLVIEVVNRYELYLPHIVGTKTE